MEDILVKEIGMKPTKWKSDNCTEYSRYNEASDVSCEADISEVSGES